MNIYEQVANWLKQYTPLGKWLYFNVTNYEAGCVSLNSVTSVRTSKRFITGAKQVDLTVAIDMIKDYDGGTSTTNLEAMQEVNVFRAWIEEQNTTNNLPNFGEGIEVKEVTLLENAPSIAVDNSQHLAKYQFQININYREE